MLIKPLGEYKPPRHTLDEEEENAPPIPQPTIVIDFPLKDEIIAVDSIIVVPSTLSSVADSLVTTRTVGSITVKYDVTDLVPPPNIRSEGDQDEEDYNIIEQLYSANKINKFETGSLDPIDIKLHTSANFSIISIVVPRYSNIITFNLLGRAIVDKFATIVKRDWILLAPCSLNNNSTINKLMLDSNEKSPSSTSSSSALLEAIPDLKPPHFITGITASVLSQLNKVQDGKVSALTLVLDSEGHSGFEKSSSDAIVDAAFVVGSILFTNQDDQHDYIKKVSQKVRKLNGFSNSGMYI